MQEAWLRLEAVWKSFSRGTPNEKVAVADLSLTLRQGEFVTVVGSNGAGKTTLLNLIAGTHPVDVGRIYLGGEEITNEPEHARARRIGRIFQNPMAGTAGGMTVAENLSMAELRGMRRTLGWGVKRDDRRRYQAVLGELELGLEKRLNEPARLLSGGQRQSLALVMTTLRPPDLLLLDEHTAALDPKTAQKVMELTEAMVGRYHLTTIMVTHNMQQAILHGGRMIMLQEGRIRFDIGGEEKRRLTVEEMVKRFGVVADRALLREEV